MSAPDDRADRARTNWAESTSPTLADLTSRDPIVVVPVGSVEQHGGHLPVATHASLVDLDGAETHYHDLRSRYLSTDLFGVGKARRYIPFDRLSPTGTLGDPSLATREKGERILAVCTEELLAFLQEFSGW